MKKQISLWLLLLLASAVFAQEPAKKLSCRLDHVPFESFQNFLFREAGVKLFYTSNSLKDLTVNLQEDSLNARQLVEKVLGPASEYFVSEWNGHLVLLKGEQLPVSLPLFGQNTDVAQSSAEQTGQKTAFEERYLSGRAPEVVESIRVGTGAVKASGKAKVLGRVLDSETGEAIYNATLYFPNLETGSVTDDKGFVSFQLKTGKHLVRVDFLGYERRSFLLDVVNDGSFIIRLPRTVIQMKEFVVYGDKQMGMRSKDPGLDKISMKSIRELPMMMGERDVLRVSGTLPGIVSTGEGASGIHVRGGSSDQNAFYINKIPVYNTSHLFGFFPAFNSEIIRDFSVYKGHVPAEFGGRLSSVFNISTRQGNRKRFSVHGGISPVTGNIVVEGPLLKDTCSVLLSARSTYSDWLLQRIEDPEIKASSAAFNDFAGGLNYDFRNTQLSVFGYRSYDRFRLADVNDYNYTNQGVSLGLSHTFNPALRAELSLVAATYDFETKDRHQATSAYTHAYRTGHYEARLDLKQMVGNSHTFAYGMGAVLYKLNRGVVQPYGMASLRETVDMGNEQGLETSLYFSDSWEPSPRLNVTLGLRMGMFTPFGPSQVLTYLDGFPKDLRYVDDTLSFAKNAAVKWYPEPDIRAAVNYTTDENGSLKFAFNQMHQHLFLLNNTVSISPGAQWKLADYHLKPSSSNQFSLGVFRNLNRPGLEFSVEFYYKFSNNYPEFRDGADFIASPYSEAVVLQGKQKSYGMEFFLKRNNKRLDGWLSYTYSRSLIQVNDPKPFNTINNGKIFPSNYDMPHVVNMVLNYKLRRRIILSSITTWQTGRPSTFPVSFYYVNGVPMLDYSDRNAYRLPDYFRTDASITFEGSLKKKKLVHSSLVISVYNLTGRENPYSVYFKNEDGHINSYQYSVIGVPILTATWLFKLGNYATE